MDAEIEVHNRQSLDQFTADLEVKTKTCFCMFQFARKKFHRRSQPEFPIVLKGTGHFFQTLSVGSVPGTDHS